MSECKACGREAGPNKVYCDEACIRLADHPHTLKQQLADAYTRGRNDEANARQAQTQNELRLIAELERVTAERDIAERELENNFWQVEAGEERTAHLATMRKLDKAREELELEKIKSRNERAYIAQFMGVSR